MGTRTYDVLRDAAPIASGITYGTTSFTDTTTTGGQSYTYTVRYNNGCGLSSVTNPGAQAADDDDTTPPGNVDNTLLVSKSSPNVMLNWSTVPDAAFYRVYRSEDPSLAFPTNWMNIESPYSNNHNDPVLINASNYYYKILASDTCGNLSSN
ncbi:MAG: hypothetical protein A2Y62_20290 [Candidatus Fischerbacteria bacterium RBG_13_37_8]|uniref:Fibronectin type-III domain-containing protein n=1 Tax=Candidatus Fischerbacteria bacterium RBG_13_37_8 TaxID=1817863 RepID=A0A1F5VGX2_9BACT|nr:MAG: hypothetical protein A2Y62_20290 [Candidatus Fischerbacteria bacterium RBG_13_37_8]